MKSEVKHVNVEPDIFALEEDWKRQPGLYKEEADKLADLRLEYDLKKLRLEEVEAELDYDIRQHPNKYGLDKITEAVVDKAIKRCMEYMRAAKEMLYAKHAVAIQENTVTALEHKKKALEKAVDLWINDYYSTPRARSAEARDVTSRKERGSSLAELRGNR